MEKILFISSSTQDKKTWILTIIFSVLPLTFFGWKMLHSSAFDRLAVLFACFLLLTILGFAATPYKYIISGTDLIIKRYWRDIYIPLSDIQSIGLIPKSEKKTIWRSFGYAGPFGYFGFFTSVKYAKLSVFARRFDHLTLIITDRKKYVIAPDDLQLIDAVMQQIGKTEADMQQEIDVPTSQWRKYIPMAIVAAILFFVYTGYKDPRVVFDTDTLIMKGRYGVNIPYIKIAEADTITWLEMPATRRTNGISTFKVHRGNFRTTDGGKVRLSINSGSSPIIRISDRDGVVYYINRKNAAETRQIFNSVKP